jgi:arylsulfatase
MLSSRVAGRLARALSASLITLCGGCGGGDGEAAGRGDAAPPAAWHRVEDGWAKGIALDRAVTVDAVRGGDAFEAVVFPGAPGVLTVESGGLVEKVEVASPTRVAVATEEGEPATVSFSTAGAVLHAPRIVREKSLRRAAGGEAQRGAGAEPRRILLAVADTLRADAVSEDTMPELLGVFAEGARFTRAYAAATWTLPSMASLFTGKAPSELALPDGTLIALAPDEPTLASDLAARGFHTVGISANYTVHHENGFSSGFELYLVPAVLGHGEWPDATWVLDRARRVVEWFPDRDLFLYLHLMDPHDPYRNHETGDSIAAPTTGATVAAEEAERMRAAYRSEARRLDGLLAGFLREAGPFERLVVTADHGEEFLEHGGWKHGPTVYPEVSRVPLLVSGRGVRAGGVEIPVSLLALRAFLAGGDGARLRQDDPAIGVESFVHAAPRFSWAHRDGQAILFARDLTLGAPGAAAGGVVASSAGAVGGPDESAAAAATSAPADPVGVWLRQHHPPLDFVGVDGAPRDPGPDEAWETALRLAARFHGMREGFWVLVPPGSERVRVELPGANGGWWWGAARRVGLEASAAQRSPPGASGAASAASDTTAPLPVLEVVGADPFALVFVAGARSATAVPAGGAASGGDRLRPLELSTGPPRARLDRVAIAWQDGGRPAGRLEGVEETLRRLRAQGYL